MATTQEPSREYRDRIYRNYLSTNPARQAPHALADLRTVAPYLRKLVREHFPADKNARIIDLGCGQGALIAFAREAGYTNVTGIDRSPEQVEVAQRLGIQGVEQGDLMEILGALPQGSVDLLIAFDVIEHFSKDEVVLLLRRACDALEQKGRMIVHTPNGGSPFAGEIFFGDFTHELCFTRGSIAQLFRSCGFAEVTSYEDAPVPHGAKSGARWLLWKCIRGFLRFWTAVETGDMGRQAIFTRNFLTVADKAAARP